MSLVSGEERFYNTNRWWHCLNKYIQITWPKKRNCGGSLWLSAQLNIPPICKSELFLASQTLPRIMYASYVHSRTTNRCVNVCFGFWQDSELNLVYRRMLLFALHFPFVSLKAALSLSHFSAATEERKNDWQMTMKWWEIEACIPAIANRIRVRQIYSNKNIYKRRLMATCKIDCEYVICICELDWLKERNEGVGSRLFTRSYHIQ